MILRWQCQLFYVEKKIIPLCEGGDRLVLLVTSNRGSHTKYQSLLMHRAASQPSRSRRSATPGHIE